jgi:hypothetical protein
MVSPMSSSRRSVALFLSLFALGASALTPGMAAAAEAPDDPIQVEIDRFQDRIAAAPAGDEEAKSIREGSLPLLDLAERALGDGNRWFALSRLAYVWTNLEAVDYRAGFSSELRGQMSALEREFERVGPELAAFAEEPVRPSFVEAPAIARAMGEIALSELDGYYAASLVYGRATASEFGLFYIGAAKAQIGLARFASTLRDSGAAYRPLEPRSVTREIAAVQDELLAAYVPPAAIDQHPVFIRISALLKQAEELDAAGLRYGALYKLLDAKMRVARLLQPERKLSADEAGRRALATKSRLDTSGVDATIAEAFVEIALVQVADPDPAMMGGETAAAVFEDVLPLYFTLLGPAEPAPAEQVAEVTVTLIRWPYT